MGRFDVAQITPNLSKIPGTIRLEKLTATWLLEQFPTLYGIKRFVLLRYESNHTLPPYVLKIQFIATTTTTTTTMQGVTVIYLKQTMFLGSHVFYSN